MTDPSGIRFAVTGNILGIKGPRSVWNKHFGQTIPVGNDYRVNFDSNG